MPLPKRLPFIAWCISLLGLGILAWLVIQNHVDPDLWWRIRHGQDILAHGISTKEAYDYTMPSFPFVDHAWSLDVVLGWLMNHGGYAAMTALVTLTTTLLFTAVTYSRREQWAGPLSVLLLWAGAIGAFGVRVQAIAWPFLFLTIWLALLSPEQWKKWRWSIPLIALIWANVHGSFPIFFLLLGLRSLVSWWEAKRIDFTDFALLLVSIPITLINPYGFGLWHEVWLTNTDSTLRSTISEWQPLWVQASTTVLLFALLFGAGLGVALFRKSWKSVALIGATAVLGISSMRHVVLFIFTSTVCLVGLVADYNFAPALANIKKDIVLRRVLAGGLIFSVLFLLWIPLNVFLTQKPDDYPTDAVAVIEKQYPNAVVLNHYDWGGYLIWNRPDAKVFIDGRMPSWRWQAPAGELDWAHRDWDKIGKGDQQAFDKDVALFHIDTVLWKVPWGGPNAFLTMLKNEGWQEVYADENAVIYRSPAASPALAQ